MTPTRSPNRRHDLPLLNKYTSARTAQAILRSASLRWSSPRLFNDPFDVPREFGLPFTADELRSALAARLEAYVAGQAEPASQTVFAIMADMVNEDPSGRGLMLETLQDSLHLMTIPTENAMQQFPDAWDEKVRGLRILCLSAISDSPAMWAHYADDHQGVVLQFESDDGRDSATLLATPVMYRAEPPTLPLVERWARAFLGEEEIDWDEYFQEYYYVKSVDWSYEQEYRVISSSPDDSQLYDDSPFLREDLRGIILGTAIDRDDEATIRDLAAGYPNAVIYRARLDHRARRVKHDLADSD